MRGDIRRLEQTLGETEVVLRMEIQGRAARQDIRRLEQELLQKASSADLEALAAEVAILKEAEKQPIATPDMQTGTEIAYDAGKPLDGIIAHLTRLCGGNVHEKGVVEVTASSVWAHRSGFVAQNAVDFESLSEFRSNDEANSWICYEFKERRVVPTSYSIRSFSAIPGSAHPKSWVFEVSNDGSEGSWEIIDTRENNSHLDDEFVVHNFQIQARPRESFRFIRLRQTGENHFGNHFLFISALEVFGTLYDE